METNPIQRLVEDYARERAEWIDTTCFKAVPKWKSDIIRKYKSKLLARLLFVKLDIIYETLIADFGTRVIIKLNGKVIGERKFKY